MNERIDATEEMVWVCLENGGQAWARASAESGWTLLEIFKGGLSSKRTGTMVHVRRGHKYQIQWPESWTLPKRVAEIDADAALYLQTEACLIRDFRMGNALNSCFIWRESKKGDLYWRNIYDKLLASKVDREKPKTKRIELYRRESGDLAYSHPYDSYLGFSHTSAPSIKGFIGYEYEEETEGKRRIEPVLFSNPNGGLRRAGPEDEIEPVFPVAFWVKEEV